jgi:sugar phosphate permease
MPQNRGLNDSTLPLRCGAESSPFGAALSQVIAGSIVRPLDFHAGFLFLAAVVLVAFAILYLLMPETRNTRMESA